MLEFFHALRLFPSNPDPQSPGHRSPGERIKYSLTNHLRTFRLYSHSFIHHEAKVRARANQIQAETNAEIAVGKARANVTAAQARAYEQLAVAQTQVEANAAAAQTRAHVIG
uniref:Uncharacterized protein n=1 Tax=Acrobeloides nanus TaxID=290746 RepID=A0A914EGZ3_9BILA